MFSQLLLAVLPPIIYLLPLWLLRHLRGGALPPLPVDYRLGRRGHHGLFKLIRDYEFTTVLDVGAGEGAHAALLHQSGKEVTALDFSTSVYASKRPERVPWPRVDTNFLDFRPDAAFDCLWACHVLEHQTDPGAFIRHCMALTRPEGIIAITVPPLKHRIVGGHLSLWNAGLLLYQLTFNGIDTCNAAVCTYGYNISVIVRNRQRPDIPLDYDKGDLDKLRPYMPAFVSEPFDGRIQRWNW